MVVRGKPLHVLRPQYKITPRKRLDKILSGSIFDMFQYDGNPRTSYTEYKI